MPHNPFLDDHEETPGASNPFLPSSDPEDPEEDRNSIRGLVSRFGRKIAGFLQRAEENIAAGNRRRDPTGISPTLGGQPTASVPDQNVTDPASAFFVGGPARSLGMLARGFGDLTQEISPDIEGLPDAGLSPDDIRLPGEDLVERAPIAGAVGQAMTDMGTLFAGGAGVGNVLSRIGASQRLARGGGFLGDVARFGPVDVGFAQNPETSGAVGLAELAGQDDLAESLRGNRALRSLAEVSVGALPVGAIMGAGRAAKGQQRFARRAAGMRPDPSDAERLGLEVTGRVPSLEVTRELPPSPLDRIRRGADEIRGDADASGPSLEFNVKPGEGRARQSKTPRVHISEVEEAATGEPFRATLFRGAQPDTPLGTRSPAGARFFAERPEKSVGFTAEAREIARSRVEEFIDEQIPFVRDLPEFEQERLAGRLDEAIFESETLGARVEGDLPAASAVREESVVDILEDQIAQGLPRIGAQIRRQTARDIVGEFRSSVMNRLPFDTATPGKGRQLFKADVELDNPFVLDENSLDDAARIVFEEELADPRNFDEAALRVANSLEPYEGLTPAEVTRISDDLADTAFEGAELGRPLDEIRAAMANELRAIDDQTGALRSVDDPPETLADEALASIQEDPNLQQLLRGDASDFRQALETSAISGGERGDVSAAFLRAARERGHDGVISRLGDQFDRRAFSGAEIVAFDEAPVRDLSTTEAREALEEFAERIRRGEPVTEKEITDAGFTIPEVMGVLGRVTIGGVGGTVASTQIEGLDPLAGAIGGAALGAGAPQLLRFGTKGLDKVADWRAARSAENLGDAADDVLPELEQLSKSDQKFLRDILEADDISGAAAREADPVDEAVRVTVPKDLDANEVTARLDAKLAQSATRRQRSEQYQRVRKAIQEGRLDDEQLKIDATIAKIGRMDPQTVAQALRTGEPEQVLAESLRYGTATEGLERLQTLMGRIGGQLPPQQLDILQAKVRELNEMADDAMANMLGGLSEAGRALRMGREKIRSLPLDPKSINLHEARARQVAEGSFDSDDRARLLRILSDNAEPDVADIMVASALGRTVTGGIVGSGIGLVADGKEGAAVGALAGMGAGAASLPVQRISQINRAGDLLQPGGQLRNWIDSLEPDDRKALLLTRFMQEMEGRAKSGGEKVAQFIKAGLLTAVKTDIINLASTTSWMAARRVGNAPAALIDRVLGKATGQRSVAFQRPTLKGGFAKFDEETGEVVMETGRLRNALNEAREVWRGQKQARDALKRLDFSGYRSGNAFVDGMMTYGFRRLGAEDRAMKGLAFHTALHERARIQAMNEGVDDVAARVKELVASPPDDLAMRAWADAEEATFTNVNAAGEAVVDFKRALRRQGSMGALVADVGVPFVNTLVNVADSFLKTSPLGFVRPKTMRNFGKLLSDANNMPLEAQRELSQALALATTGTVAPFAVGAVLWQKGLMTGPWPTDDQANVMAQGNFQPYSLILGDHTVSMENVSPWGNVMSLGAHTMSLAADAEVTGAETAAKVRQFDELPAADKLSVAGEVARNPEIWTGMTGAAFSQLSELSFLATVTTILEGVTDPGRSGALFDNLGRMVVPTAARQAAASDIPVIGDPTFRDGGGPLGLGDIPGIRAIIASTPGLSRTLEPQIDRLGQERKRDPSNFFESAGNPFRIEKIEDNPIIRELTRLGVGIGDLTTPDRRDVEDAEKLTQLRKVYGRVLARRLEAVVQSDPFQRLGDDRRREVLESTIRSTRSQTSRALQEIGELPPVPEDEGEPAPFFQRVGERDNPFLPEGGTTDTTEGVGRTGNPFLP